MNKLQIKLIAILQVIGGLWGVFLIISSGLSVFSLGLLIATLVFLFCFTCGILLLLNVKPAIELSMVNQLMQVLSFSGLGITLRYFTPFNIELAFMKGTGLILDFRLSSKLQFSLEGMDNDFISINFVALFFLITLNSSRDLD